MTSSIKQRFGIYDGGSFAIVMFSSDGKPGRLPDYFELETSASKVLGFAEDLSWFELDTTDKLNKFEICKDLLLGDFEYDVKLVDLMASFYSGMRRS